MVVIHRYLVHPNVEKGANMTRRVALRAVSTACLGLTIGCLLLTLSFCLLRLR